MMLPITNEKVAGLEPRWADFRGFTLLFDNPGASLKTVRSVAYLDCDVDENPDLSLYQALRDALQQIGLASLSKSYLFCPLPPESYHVTVWDGINASNLDKVVSEHRPACQRFLQALPNSVQDTRLFPEITNSELLTRPDWRIRFKFAKLEKWGNVSIVALLEPADDESAVNLRALKDARAILTSEFERKFGVGPYPNYTPHVTLGYFANQDLAEQASPRMDAWNESFHEITAGFALELQQVSLYGFTDMATFFKAA
jgi:hypothetical protein